MRQISMRPRRSVEVEGQSFSFIMCGRRIRVPSSISCALPRSRREKDERMHDSEKTRQQLLQLAIRSISSCWAHRRHGYVSIAHVQNWPKMHRDQEENAGSCYWNMDVYAWMQRHVSVIIDMCVATLKIWLQIKTVVSMKCWIPRR